MASFSSTSSDTLKVISSSSSPSSPFTAIRVALPNAHELLKKAGYQSHHPLGQMMSHYVENCKQNPTDFHAWASFAQFLAEIGPNMEKEGLASEEENFREMKMKKEAIVMYEKALSLFDDNTSTSHNTQEKGSSNNNNNNHPLKTSYYYYMSSLATLFEEIKDFDQAEFYYKKVLDADPNHPVALGNYAIFLHRRKKEPYQAEEYYEKSTIVHPLHASIITKFGSYQKSIHNDDMKAESYYQKAVDACPTNVESLGAYAVYLHSRKKDLEKAAMLYKQALDLDPEHVNILTNYGLFLSENCSNFQESKKMYQRALAIEPTHANCLYNLAVLFDSGLQDHKKAEALYRLALQSNPRHAYALYNLAILLEEKITNQVQIITNSEQVITVGSVRVQKETKDYQPVKELFQKCIALTQNDAMTLSDYGRFLFLREKNFTKGEEILRKAIQCDKSYAPGFFYLGMLLLNQCEHEEADLTVKTVMEVERWLKRTLSLNNMHSGAYTLLGRLYSKNPKKFKQAEDNYKKALAISPNNIELLHEYSKFLSQQKHTASKDLAKELMRRAISLENMKSNANRKTYTSKTYNLREQDPRHTDISQQQEQNQQQEHHRQQKQKQQQQQQQRRKSHQRQQQQEIISDVKPEESTEESFAHEVFGHPDVSHYASENKSRTSSRNGMPMESQNNKLHEEEKKPLSLSSFINTESKYQKPEKDKKKKNNSKMNSPPGSADTVPLPTSALDLVEISSPLRSNHIKPINKVNNNELSMSPSMSPSISRLNSNSFPSPTQKKNNPRRVLNGPDDVYRKSKSPLKEKPIQGNEKDLEEIASAVKDDFDNFDVSELKPLSEGVCKSQFADDLKNIQNAISQLVSIHSTTEMKKPLPFKESKYTASINVPVLPSSILASASASTSAAVKSGKDGKDGKRLEPHTYAVEKERAIAMEKSPNRKRRPVPLPPQSSFENNQTTSSHGKKQNDPVTSAWTSED